ncbi:conserved hypothetical protein [Neospora caninum Liverpool]|uniref:Uncharacterized protein n=1 Tax=Neospora caninum (strain Liverpool) TaxID=572307 RepID=F0V7R8_NEOCL|nr:conserved hypothetical protein [Neospora caninum Liverpool]CBZ49759.1 conserved hypothetical protein [Neospora caninum Liverpool]CEL64344.1 TPA: hypothetical protein BN1204_002470 [Neospora caninum Liverpool]|eukprot:XP_003879794.1 conserved hypothetical protein [Neospora caninum Liverpool]
MSPLLSSTVTASARPRLPPLPSRGVSGASPGPSSPAVEFSSEPELASQPRSFPPPSSSIYSSTASARSAVKPPTPSFPASGATRPAPSCPSEAASPSVRNSPDAGTVPLTNGVRPPSQTRVGRDPTRRPEERNGEGPGPRVPPLQLQTRVSSVPPPSAAVRLNAKLQEQSGENGAYVAAAAWMRATEAARLLLGEPKGGGNSGIPTPAAADGRGAALAAGSPKAHAFARAGKRLSGTPLSDLDGAAAAGNEIKRLQAEVEELRGQLAEQERRAAEQVRELEKRERDLCGRVQELEQRLAQTQPNGFSEAFDTQELQQLQHEHRKLQQREQDLLEKERELQRQLEQHQKQLEELHREVKELHRSEAQTNGVDKHHEADAEQRAHVERLERKVKDVEKLHREAAERDAMRIRALEEENNLLKRATAASASHPGGGRSPVLDAPFQLRSLQQLQEKLQSLKQRHLQALEAAGSAARDSEDAAGKPAGGETGDQENASAVFDDFDMLLQKLAAAQGPQASGSGAHALGPAWGGVSRRRSLSRCSSASRLAAPPLPPGAGENTTNAGVALSGVSGHATGGTAALFMSGGRLLPPTPSACSSVVSDSVARSSVGRRLMSSGVIAAAVQQVQQAVAKSIESEALARQKAADLRNFHRKSFSELATRLAGTVAVAHSLAGSRGAPPATPSHLSVTSNACGVPQASPEIPSGSSMTPSSFLPAPRSGTGPSAVQAYPASMAPANESSSGCSPRLLNAGKAGTVEQVPCPSLISVSPFMQACPSHVSGGPPRPSGMFGPTKGAEDVAENVPAEEFQERGKGEFAPRAADSPRACEGESMVPKIDSDMVPGAPTGGERVPAETEAGSASPAVTSGGAATSLSTPFPCAMTPPSGTARPAPVSAASPASVPARHPFQATMPPAGPLSHVSPLSGVDGQPRQPSRDPFGVQREVSVPVVSAHAVRSLQAIPAFASPPPARPEPPAGAPVSAASANGDGASPSGSEQEGHPTASGVAPSATGAGSAPVEVGVHAWHAVDQGQGLSDLGGDVGDHVRGRVSQEGSNPLPSVADGACRVLLPPTSALGRKSNSVDCAEPPSVPRAGHVENGESERARSRMEAHTVAGSQTVLPASGPPAVGARPLHAAQAQEQSFPVSLPASRCPDGSASLVPMPVASQSIPPPQSNSPPPGSFGVGAGTSGVASQQQIGAADEVGTEGKGFWDEDDLDEWNIDDVSVQSPPEHEGPSPVPRQASSKPSSQLLVHQPSDKSLVSQHPLDSFTAPQLRAKERDSVCALGSPLPGPSQGLRTGVWQSTTHHQQPLEGPHGSRVPMPPAQQRPTSAGHRPIEDLFS